MGVAPPPCFGPIPRSPRQHFGLCWTTLPTETTVPSKFLCHGEDKQPRTSVLSSFGIMLRILVVFGTRPEAIKMAPLVSRLKADPAFSVTVCSTGQHREMLRQILALFDLSPDIDLDLMRPGQGLPDLTAAVLSGVSAAIRESQPDRVLVHGDTTTTLAATLASFYARIPVGHVEAGLRTHDIYAPWPEEVNRRVTDVIADRLYAPTESSRANLLREGVPEDGIVVTGNTVIDALFDALNGPLADRGRQEAIEAEWPFVGSAKRIILVTGHRRESFGSGFANICTALGHLADRTDVHIVYPVHLNPNVQAPVKARLSGRENISLIEPLDYLPFIHLMSKCDVVLTDSGGIQEEAPSLGKPVFVMRTVTERPEAVEAGTVRLVGTDVDRIVAEVAGVLDHPDRYEAMRRVHNPYGDGQACARIIASLKEQS